MMTIKEAINLNGSVIVASILKKEAGEILSGPIEDSYEIIQGSFYIKRVATEQEFVRQMIMLNLPIHLGVYYYEIMAD